MRNATRSGWVAGLVVTLAVAVGIAASALAQTRVFRSPTAAELAPPASSGTVLRSQALGFEMPLPVGLTFLADDDEFRAQLVETMGSIAERMVVWRWAGADGSMVLVMIDLESRRSADARDEYVRTVLETAASDMRAAGVTVTTARRGPADHAFRATDPSSGTALMVTRVFGYEHGDSFVVVSIASAAGPLEHVVDGARGRD